MPEPREEPAETGDNRRKGESVGDAGAIAGLAPITAAKTLHRFGESVTPLAMDVVEDWLAGDLSRSDAKELIGAGVGDGPTSVVG